jgi:tetratricopeptide (TPR) repeat protein
MEDRNYKQAVKMLKIGLKTYSDDWKAWNYLGDALLALKRSTDALKAYKKSIQLNQDNLPVALKTLDLTKRFKLKKELAQAYQNVIRLDSTHVEAAAKLAYIRYHESNFKEAAALYRLVVQHTYGDKVIWSNYGTALLKINRPAKAKEALQNAIHCGAEGRSVKVKLAELYVRDKELSEAEYLISEIMQKTPDYHPGLYLMGLLSFQNAQHQVAVDYLKKAVEVSPSTIKYYEALAEVYFSQGRYTTAGKTLDKVKSSLSYEGRTMPAQCYFKAGRVNTAVKAYTELYQILKYSSPWLKHISQVRISHQPIK